MENILFDFISKHISLSDEEKSVMLSLGIFHTFKKGTVLLKAGLHSIDGYFVLSGCIRTFYVIDGVERTTEFYTELEGLTPNCVISGGPSEHFVSCVEDSIVTVSDPEMESTIFERFPKFETLCRVLSEQLLAKSQSKLDEFKTSSAEQRYLSLVQNRPELLQRVPQHQLASYLGITPQSLSRMRSRLGDKHKKVALRT
ncbi:MAG: Crp/Fnr family transcriptional regulator [Flavobacteriales bacterium]